MTTPYVKITIDLEREINNQVDAGFRLEADGQRACLSKIINNLVLPRVFISASLKRAASTCHIKKLSKKIND